MRAAGFADIRAVNLAVHLPVASPQTCWDFHMSHGSPRSSRQSGGIVLDRGAVAYLATVPANDPSEPGSHS